MASKLVEQLLNGVAGTISLILQEKLVDVFRKLHTHDPAKHSATLRSLYIGLNQLEDITDDTKTKLDDAGVDAIKGAVEESAKEFDVELPNE